MRLLLTTALPGADNMALDEALLERARDTGETCWRVYTWSSPTLSLGRNQTAAGHYDLDRAAALGIDVVRRPTGGRAVLHHREITYAVAAPAPAEGSLRESYAAANAVLHLALARLGAPVTAALPTRRTGAPGLAPCFELPTRDELVLDGRKLVGSAQWRDDGAFLQHGSILVDDDQGMIATLCRQPLPAVPPPATLRQALGRAPMASEFAEALLAVLCEGGAAVTRWDGDVALTAAVQRLRARYLDPAWTWRR